MLGKEEIVSPSLDELKEHYHRILTLLGEDAGREGLQKTPERVAKAMLSLTKGYHMDPHEVLRSAKFQEEYSQMVIVKDIDFFSLCEHHMLPFYGKAHVAYIPNGYITGLSKIARVVDNFSSPASAGTHDTPDKGVYPGDPESAGGYGCCGGQTHVHADARSRETELHYHYIRFYRSIQPSEDPRGIYEFNQA